MEAISIKEAAQRLINGQWSATTGATSIQLYRKTEGASVKCLLEYMIAYYDAAQIKISNGAKLTAACRWMKHSKKSSLILMGDTGTGKTTLAQALSFVIGVVNPCPCTYTMQQLERIAKDSPGWFDEIVMEKRYLILDDLGTESRDLNDWGTYRVIFNELVARRYDYHLPVIITTNLNSTAIREQYGEKTASRLAERCDILVMAGNDFRYESDNH